MRRVRCNPILQVPAPSGSYSGQRCQQDSELCRQESESGTHKKVLFSATLELQLLTCILTDLAAEWSSKEPVHPKKCISSDR